MCVCAGRAISVGELSTRHWRARDASWCARAVSLAKLVLRRLHAVSAGVASAFTSACGSSPPACRSGSSPYPSNNPPRSSYTFHLPCFPSTTCVTHPTPPLPCSQPLSKQPSSTGFAFGKESREGYNTNPSPSDQFLFDAEKSMGTQVSSKRVTSPRAHMGTGTRDSATATYNVHTYKPH